MASLTVDGLKKGYGSGLVLDGIDLAVESGEIFGLLGPNGAGKTTLFQTVIGLLTPDAGAVRINGDVPDEKTLKQKMSYLPADAHFYGNMSGRHNLEYFARLAGTQPAVDELLELVDLTTDADRKVSAYSTGMRKRLGIAQSLLKDPDILIYDEPTTGLDPAGKQEFRQLVEKINQENNKTVIISSHVTTEIEPLCDRFGILHNGTIAARGTTAELSTQTDNTLNIRLDVEKPENAVDVLEQMDVQFDVEQGTITITAETDIRSTLFTRLVEQDVMVKTLELHAETLETAYLNLTR